MASYYQCTKDYIFGVFSSSSSKNEDNKKDESQKEEDNKIENEKDKDNLENNENEKKTYNSSIQIEGKNTFTDNDDYSKEEIHDIVLQKLELVGLKGITKLFPSELSGGMQKRVSFARAIVTNPNTILYDEPTAGLDPISSTLIEDYIVRLKNETHAASIVVTHQMSTISRTSDKERMLYNGKAVFEGTPNELCAENTEYTRQFVRATLEGPMKMN